MNYQFSDCLAMRTRKLSRMIDARFRSMVRSYGISENQLSILFFLFKKEVVEQGIIGKVFYLERSTVSRNVNVLQKMGLVEKSSDHRPLISITAKGKEIVEEIIPKWHEITESLYQQLGTQHTQSLYTMEQILN